MTQDSMFIRELLGRVAALEERVHMLEYDVTRVGDRVFESEHESPDDANVRAMREERELADMRKKAAEWLRIHGEDA